MFNYVRDIQYFFLIDKKNLKKCFKFGLSFVNNLVFSFHKF